MGELLVDVLSTNDRGIVGFTEDGREIPLSAPTSSCYIFSGVRNSHERGVQEILECCQLVMLGGLIEPFGGDPLQLYDSYTERAQ